MRLTIETEDGTTILLRCTDAITDRLSATELILYLYKTLIKHHPERMRNPQEFKVIILVDLP